MSSSSWIAERTLRLDGQPSGVHVRIALPERVGPGEYACRYAVTGLAIPKAGQMHGVDSMQALVLALHMTAVVLESSAESRAGRLEQDDVAGFGMRYPDDGARQRRGLISDRQSVLALQLLEDWIEAEVMPLAWPHTLDLAIGRLVARLDGERATEMRLLLLARLEVLLQVGGREVQARAAIDEQTELVPADPRPFLRLAAWHRRERGHDADAVALTGALEVIEVAVDKARAAGFMLRHCLNERARIATALDRFDVVEATLQDLLALRPEPPMEDACLAEDFLPRLPAGAVDEELVRRYRTAAERDRRMAEAWLAPPVAEQERAPSGGAAATHSFDQLVAWTALTDEELRQEWSPPAVEALRSSIGQLLDDDPFATIDRENFPAIIRMLAAAHGQGARSLGRALVEAGEHRKQGQATEFGAALRRFIERSPTRFHRQIAERYLTGTTRDQ